MPDDKKPLISQEFTVTWGPNDATPPAVNQFLIAKSDVVAEATAPEYFYLRFGHINPPVMMENMSAEQAAELARVPLVIQDLGWFAFTPARLAQLRDTIAGMLDRA